MTEHTPGTTYVYRDEDGDAIAVARHRVGPNGGWTADTLARMSVPSKHVTRDELNAYALTFAAAPELLEALEAFVAYLDKGEGTLPHQVEYAMRDAIAKARGGQS